MRFLLVPIAILALTGVASAQTSVETATEIRNRGLRTLKAWDMLYELSEGIGPRISGSEGYEKAVNWGVKTLQDLGFQNVRKQPCMIPHWVRGDVERCGIVSGASLTIAALGNSGATPKGGLSAPVIEVKSLKEAEALGDQVRGKILFFNRPFDQTFLTTGSAYGAAGDQRFSGPALAAKLGAKAALVRSLTAAHDDVPHTGTTRFEGDNRIPAAALSLVAADRLSGELKQNPNLEVELELACQNLPDVPSFNVMGELVGTEKPKEVIVMGGHLDAWDKGRGAHDDGAGIVHAIEALRLIKESGIRPKRTIRVVLWANEEMSGSGAAAYAEAVKKSGERHIAGIESDAGGFAPRGVSTSLSAKKAKKFLSWQPILALAEANDLKTGGGGGADVGPLAQFGTALFGLNPESQRYFDYHHSAKDTIDKVHPRELELGAITVALLAWLISENGL